MSSEQPAPRGDIAAAWARLPSHTRGALWMLGAAFSFSTMAMTTKFVGQSMDSFQVAFFRCLFGFLAVAPMILRAGVADTFRTSIPAMHLVRSIVGAAALACFFYALANAPLADVTAVSFAKPLFMIFLAVLFLGEKVRWRRWTATVIGFVGVLIMARPGHAGFDIDLLAAVGGAAFVAIAMTLVKKISATEGTLTMLAYFGVVSSILLLGPALYVWRWPSWEEWFLLGAIGAMGAFGQNCLIRAYRSGEATQVAPFDYSRLLFAVAFGWFIFAETPNLWMLAGALLIVASTLYIARREARLGAEPRESEREATARKL